MNLTVSRLFYGALQRIFNTYLYSLFMLLRSKNMVVYQVKEEIAKFKMKPSI